MKKISLLALLIVPAFVGANELEPHVKAAPPAEARSDPERGIFVKVQRYPDRMPNGSSSTHGSRVEEEGGVKVLISRTVRDTETVEERIRLTEETLSHLITSEKEPDHLRWRAILNIDRAQLGPEKTIALYTKAIGQKKALLRSAASRILPNFKPRKDAIPLFVELLKDPCLDVAHDSLGPLVEFYDLKGAAGGKIELNTWRQGLAFGVFQRDQAEVLEVATRLRASNPAQVSEADLDRIHRWDRDYFRESMNVHFNEKE